MKTIFITETLSFVITNSDYHDVAMGKSLLRKDFFMEETTYYPRSPNYGGLTFLTIAN